MNNASYHSQQLQEPPAQGGSIALPAGWTEHKAPSGHTYYFNKLLNKSTYTRPETIATTQPNPLAQPVQPIIPSYSAGQFANGFNPTQFQAFTPQDNRQHNAIFGAQYQHHRGPPRSRQDNDRPKHKYSIPGCTPWILVKTRLGRRFVHNTDTGKSLWRFPETVMSGVIEYDRRQRENAERKERGASTEVYNEEEAEFADAKEIIFTPARTQKAEDDKVDGESDYEEIEVTESEAESEAGDDTGEGPSKRQRTDEPEDQGPVEFDEDDMAWQMQAMEEHAYSNGGDEEGYFDEEPPLTDEDARALFTDLLSDHHISPFTPWQTIIDEGRLVDDPRYLALPNMKSRRETFDTWSRDRLHLLKEEREKATKTDPRIPYFELLDKEGSAKLYWPEFKRKFRKELAMKDAKVSEKDKEKYYREHVKRLALSKDLLKKDLSTLLKSLPLSVFNRSTDIRALPSQILTDLRLISLPPKTRDPMIEAYISTLGPAPESNEGEIDAAAVAEKRRERDRREKALREREERVQEAQLRHARDVKHAERRLREREEELARAMKVGKQGIKSHLEQDLKEDRGMGYD